MKVMYCVVVMGLVFLTFFFGLQGFVFVVLINSI